MKIAIIGGGVCGLYLANRLKKNNDVIVFERKKEIGENIVCSGLFSERILDFIPQSNGLIENRINHVLIHFPKKTIKVAFSKPFLVMDHSKLDKLLAEELNIIVNKSIESIPKGYDKVIGCDGYSSVVRKELNLKKLNFRLGMLGFLKEKLKSDFVEVWPLRNKSGFIWKIPRKDEIEYGIIGDIKSSYDLFEKFLKEKGIVLESIKSKLIPEGFALPENENITLCGDSAGLTKPWSGGGVIWGITAANLLAESFPDFKKYKRLADRFFKFKIFRSKLMVKLVYFIGFNIPYIMPNKAKIESDFLL